MDLFKTKEDICREFNVSKATIDNWIKIDLIPDYQNENGYTIEEYELICKIIKNSGKLNNRANRSRTKKKKISFLGIKGYCRKKQLREVIDLHNKLKFSTEHSILALSIIQLQSALLLKENWDTNPTTKIECFISEWMKECRFDISQCKNFSDVLDIKNDDDFIGAFYQSIKNTAEKSEIGAYYTPGNLLDNISIQGDKTVLDPCCGSGGILLRILQKTHNSNLIYARDIDETALKICRVNLTMFFNDPDMSAHIEKYDIINFETDMIKFDYLVTNPPWGSKSDETLKKQLKKLYPVLNTSESYSIALYNSIIHLIKENGTLIFFLPYSILNVATHKNIRKFLYEKKYNMKINLLGKCFPGVMSEVIRLEINIGIKSEQIQIISNDKTYMLDFSKIEEPFYTIPVTADENGFEILDKIYKKNHLKLHKKESIFAKGIITGNNNGVLNTNSVEDEPIIESVDIVPFRINEPKSVIDISNPKKFHQVAKLEKYRQKKIVFRFISNKIICAIDTHNRLLLNNANLFIPQIDYPFESIVCLLNSKVYTYIVQKKYHSISLLDWHISSLPIPIITDEKHKIFYDIHENLSLNENKNEMDKLNEFVYKIFELNQDEINIIEKNIK